MCVRACVRVCIMCVMRAMRAVRVHCGVCAFVCMWLQSRVWREFCVYVVCVGVLRVRALCVLCAVCAREVYCVCGARVWMR